MKASEFEKHVPALRQRIIIALKSIVRTADFGFYEDVAQETLLQLWNMQDKLERYRSIESLAIVIARNKAIDSLRKNHPFVGQTIPAEGFLQQSPEELLMKAEAENQINALLEKLPPVQKIVFKLRHVDGLEVSEIAILTDSNAASVRTALSRARQYIRNHFNQK